MKCNLECVWWISRWIIVYCSTVENLMIWTLTFGIQYSWRWHIINHIVRKNSLCNRYLVDGVSNTDATIQIGFNSQNNRNWRIFQLLNYVMETTVTSNINWSDGQHIRINNNDYGYQLGGFVCPITWGSSVRTKGFNMTKKIDYFPIAQSSALIDIAQIKLL